MNDANGQSGDADIERLAARLAMLASEDGEADNAGRAVGALARRMGLTGGDIKRIFLAGAASVPDIADRERLEHEVSSLRHNVMRLDADVRRTGRERDALRAENLRLQARLGRRQRSARSFRRGAAAVVLAALLAGVTAWLWPTRSPGLPAVAQEGVGFPRAAVIRPGGAQLFRDPGRSGPPLVVLPAGQRVQVHRLVWKAFFQWAEIEAPGGWSGYVLTTEIDLS